MSTAPERPRKGRSAYFWLMVCLYALLALGLCLLIAGVLTGRPALTAVALV